MINVAGNVNVAAGAATVMINGITVDGNVTLTGGGAEIPWSIKNDTIDGNVTIVGQTTSWLGVLFNKVGRNVILIKITIHDEHPDDPGVYVVRNTVESNLICTGITRECPAVSRRAASTSSAVMPSGNAHRWCDRQIWCDRQMTT